MNPQPALYIFAVMRKIALTPKQETFCLKYLEHGDASKAYREAYSCARMKAATINNKAWVLLQKGEIRARVKELQDEQKEKSAITKDRILEELANIAFSSVADMNDSWMERKDFDKLTPKQKSAIKSISTKVMKKNVGTSDNPEIIDVEYVKVELHDKIKAIERICKMLGFDSSEKKEITGAEGNPLNPQILVEVIDRREQVRNDEADPDD